MAAKKRSRRWADLELSEKLGYVWVLLFLILILGTALGILGPTFFKGG